MTDDFHAPLGVPSKLAYLIRMDENIWLRLVKEGRQETCYQTWREDAARCALEPDADLRLICLQLIPDPLFPATEREKPYVHWQEPLKRKDDKHYFLKLTITLDTQFFDRITPEMRIELMRIFQQHPSGTPYEIVLGDKVLDHGRIQ